MTAPRKPPPKREGKLSVPVPFDEAIRAALEVKPSQKPKKKPRAKKPGPKPRD